MRKATIKRFTAPDYSGTEAINTICTNLSFSGRNCKRIAFTSYMPGAGKTYISINVLYNLAKRGKRVLLVDADLRRSNIVSRLRMETDGEMLGRGIAIWTTASMKPTCMARASCLPDAISPRP